MYEWLAKWFVRAELFRLSDQTRYKLGTCKMRNEIETKRNETKRNKSKRNALKRNEIYRNKTKSVELILTDNVLQI